jgi:hypothetical protein
MSSNEAIRSELISSIYDAPLAEYGWKSTLRILSAALGDSAILFGIQPLQHGEAALVEHFIGIDSSLVRDFQTKYGRNYPVSKPTIKIG